jgi:ADP-ribose pyrophosphatase YjhB (NUDIX family)
MESAGKSILGIALVICKNPATGKYLAVYECNQTWWVPGGRVDAPEAFTTGAIRECLEEAGINVDIKGILRIEQSPSDRFDRLKSSHSSIQLFFTHSPKIPTRFPSRRPTRNLSRPPTSPSKK